MLGSSMQPVAMQSCVFCIICSFLMFVVDEIGDHIVEIYIFVLLLALHVMTSDSLSLPHLTEERTFSMGMVGVSGKAGNVDTICFTL